MATYKVQQGDSLSKIAQMQGTTVQALQQANNISNPNLIFAGSSLNIPGSVATTGVQNTTTQPIATLPKTNVIEASTLGKQVNTKVPGPVNNSSAQTNLATTAGTFLENAANNQVVTPDATQQGQQQGGTREGLLTKIQELITGQSKQGERTNQIYEEEGVFNKKTEATRLENEAISRSRAYDKQAEKIRQNTEGKLESGIQIELSDLERKKNSELADIAIQYKVAQGAYADAASIAEAKVKAEFEPFENQIKGLQMLYQLYADDMTESEKMQAEAKIREQQDTLDFSRKKELLAIKNKYDIQNDYRQASLSSGGGMATLNGKPQNATQTAANGYADRLNESNLVIDSIGGKFAGKFSQLPTLNFLKSGDRQSFEQAKRNFVTAVLRRESGAAISPTEFKTEEKKYFPQPGDKPETVKQKAISRNTVINNFYRESNVNRPALPGQIIEGDDGALYRVESDGETLTPVE
jgi:murein DD-endopeptidase MepM/ murein hydrolase activator NlpD